MKIFRVNSLATFSPEKYSRIPINGARGLLRLLCFEAGQGVPLHRHSEGDEYFYVVEGKGRILVGGEEAEVESGSIVRTPAGVLHQWKNGLQRLVLLSVIVPPQSYELADEAVKMELV